MSSDEPFDAEADNRPPEPSEQAGPQVEVPDPTGPPVPICQEQPGCSLTTTVLSLLAVGVGVLLFLPAIGTRTCGATRSTRLQWEQRQAEIDRAIAQEQACEQEAAVGSQPDRDAADE
ncbi:MAG TPA: hypothetical protein VE890_10880 [Thermoguttaceae bacterium]|nr:hypothetical protein [Thermoguttaceae bacterium]